MAFEVKGRLFEIIIASDVRERDGLAWELWELIPGKDALLVEIFRHDDTKAIEFITYSSVSIPFEALEVVINSFNTGGGRKFIVD